MCKLTRQVYDLAVSKLTPEDGVVVAGCFAGVRLLDDRPPPRGLPLLDGGGMGAPPLPPASAGSPPVWAPFQVIIPLIATRPAETYNHRYSEYDVLIERTPILHSPGLLVNHARASST